VEMAVALRPWTRAQNARAHIPTGRTSRVD
jgi:hypothetical protein